MLARRLPPTPPPKVDEVDDDDDVDLLTLKLVVGRKTGPSQTQVFL